MSGFEPALIPVDALELVEPPTGHTRLQASVEAHREDFQRLGLLPANCDVCGYEHAERVDRRVLRTAMARWIQFLCPRCRRRFLRAEMGRRG